MERPIFKPIGTPAEELDTPSLIVDVDALDHNISTVASFFSDRTAKLRPHVEAHRTPAIAHKQLAGGGHVGGIAVSSIGQAEVFVPNGFSDVFVANLVVTPQKITRLCALARQAKIGVAVDSPANVADLSEAAVANGACLDVAVYVNTRLGLYGVEAGASAIELVKAVIDAPGLEFAGIMTNEGSILADDPNEAAAESRSAIQPLLDTRQDIERAGIEVRVVSAGGTSNYQVVGAIDGVTEVPAGSYALLDAQHAPHLPHLKTAGRVMSTVTSRPEPGYMITDGGQKAIGADTGFPSIDNLPNPTVKGLSAEHGSIYFDETDGVDPKLGDRIWCTPWDAATCANLHDYIFAVRNDALESVWEVSARGRYR
ncbi:MAG: alanine racemase [Chloroflexi bacterium]|nr:alanine racemase [Chloroflexota bacterium]